MRALISVYDKRGVREFARVLENNGWEIVSTGGTYTVLKEAGLNPLLLSEVISSPEILGGRVKTLHPSVFAAVLARKDQVDEIERLNIKRFDLICCNLYPFEETVRKDSIEDIILENIDIGGVSLIRAAAKNYRNVITLTSPDDYAEAALKIERDDIDEEYRRALALKGFRITASYDDAVASFFSETSLPEDKIILELSGRKDLRYGENPHQEAALFGNPPYRKIAGEKELSFNNYQDLDAAVRLAASFEKPAAAVIKHAVPCGAAMAGTAEKAFLLARAADPLSAFGGIIGVNRRVTAELAREAVKSFFEVIAAPDFSDEALEILSVKPSVRVVSFGDLPRAEVLRQISGGMLQQSPDSFEGEKFDTVTEKHPDPSEISDLRTAWKVAAFLKSNAVAIVKDGQTLGLGSGQTARVDAVKIAAGALRDEERNFKGAVMASDGFFPFPDAVEAAAAAGITAIVQPGGSKNDSAVIEAAERLGISMVFTGRRHFLH